jgi:acyl-coenzyme A synthetase/AMP-(fatty) acid ligase
VTLAQNRYSRSETPSAHYVSGEAKYGEEVSAAVVLRGAATAQELQMFCRSRLADFEVPKQIHLVSAIPQNAMGKVQRRDLTALFT